MSIPLRRSLLATKMAVMLLGTAQVAQAQSQTATTNPSYAQLLSRVDDLPWTQESIALNEAAQGRIQQARTLLNPTVSVDIGNAFGTREYRGTGKSETTLTASQPIELPAKRRARITVAQSQAQAVALRGTMTRWQTVSRLAQAYADAEAASLRYDLAKEALSLTEQDAREVGILVREGREAQFRQIQAQSELQGARASLDEMRAARDVALARLSAIAMWERPLEGVRPQLLQSRLNAPLNERAPSSLSVQLAQAEMNSAEQQVAFEKRRALPDFSFNLGARRFADGSGNALLVGVGVTVPLFDRNSGNIRAAYADMRAAQARLAAQQLDAKAERVAATAARSASDARVEASENSVTAAREAYRLTRVGFEYGRISQLELRSVRAALVAAKRNAVDARLARATAEIELARLESRFPFGIEP